MKKIFKVCLLLILSLTANLVIFSSPKQIKAASASFYMTPSSSQVKVGANISAKIMISADAAINAGEGSVSFGSNILEFQSVSTSGSIFSFWTSGPTGNATGVSFGGGLASPGYSGTAGTVLTIFWKAKAEGVATISVSGSRILANDGTGTNIYSGSSGGTITVGPSGTTKAPSQATTVTSSSHPDQNAWYNQKKAELVWLAKSAKGYSFGFDQSATTTPGAAVNSTTKKSYDIASDGVWYFHVKAKYDTGFGPTAHYKIQVDTTPPDPFSVTINQEGGTKNPTPTATFKAADATSGIDHYEGIVDNGTPFSIANGEKLPKQKPGNHKLIIRAIDKAGNTRESESSSFSIEGIKAPEIINWTKIVGLLEGITFSGRADAEETILIYLGDEEVAKFKAGDYKISENNPSIFGIKIFAGSDGSIVWQYTVQKNLMAGIYYFRIGRIDKNGAESGLTEPLKVTVASSTIKLGKYTIPTIYLLVLLLLVIVVLIVVIILLLKKIRKLAVSGRGPIGFAYSKIVQLFSKTEKEIDEEIDSIIPEGDLSRGVVREAKKDLKEKVHETIAEEKEDIKNQQ